MDGDSRYINFGAGPAQLPTEVLDNIKSSLYNWNGQGMSVAEISHRSPAFVSGVIDKATTLVRELLHVPDDYEVILFTAPARAHFSMIPFNLLGDKNQMDYLVTGVWSELAAKEATKHGKVNVVAGVEGEPQQIQPMSSWALDESSAYLHITQNETIQGIECFDLPQTSLPIVSDMTSLLFSRPMDVSQFGVIYAGAQKNFGIAGLSVVIIRKDLLSRSHEKIPSVFNYQFNAQNNSVYYTPAALPYYVAILMMEWLQAQGGVEGIGQKNKTNTEMLYNYIDKSSFYHNSVDVAYRSSLNIPFSMAKPQLNDDLLAFAKDKGIVGIKGHRLAAGFRVSLYNSMPTQSVKKLLEVLSEFEAKHA